MLHFINDSIVLQFFELFLGETSKPLADVMEAIIGAIYLDSNFDLTQVTNMLRHIQAVDFHGTS